MLRKLRAGGLSAEQQAEKDEAVETHKTRRVQGVGRQQLGFVKKRTLRWCCLARGLHVETEYGFRAFALYIVCGQ